MSNPFGGVPDDEILEGFLCPICKKDLKTPERLTNHVETLHSEEKDLLQSLKQIFSKAKKKILNFDDVELAKTIDNSLNLGLNKLPPAQLPPLRKQEIGTDCSHMSYFKAVRNPRLERYASETNKLIIRLAKLLDNRPVDPIQRRLHEQKVGGF
jgi:rabenosyn-5